MTSGKKIKRSELEHVARLARIKLTDDEVDRFLPQIEIVLEYLDKLNTVDTTKITPTYQITDLKNVLREDKPGKSLNQEEALSSAGRTQDGYFVVPISVKK